MRKRIKPPKGQPRPRGPAHVIPPQQQLARLLLPVMNTLLLWESEDNDGNSDAYRKCQDKIEEVYSRLWELAASAEEDRFNGGEEWPDADAMHYREGEFVAPSLSPARTH